MPGEEVYFEFGIPELAMLALVLVGVYSIAEAIAWVSKRQTARLVRARAAAEEAGAGTEENEPESA